MIAFDIQAVQSRSHGERGIARFCLELAHAIEHIAPAHVNHYVVNPHRPVPASLERLMRSGKVVRSDEIDHQSLSLLHIGSPIELDLPIEQILYGQPERLVVNLFDLIPLVFRDHYLRDRNTSAQYLARLGVYNSADLVLADSHSACTDLVRLLGVPQERCRVIGAGASDAFRPPRGGPESAMSVVVEHLPTIRPGFVMLPSGIDWRKNIDGVLRAYASLPRDIRSDHQLVLVCRASVGERNHLIDLARELGCMDTFVMTGYVTEHLLVALNQAAHLVVFPSRYEGFGLPVLEARRCGAAVICGDNSSLREVQPDPRARFDADDDESIRIILDRALTDADFLEDLRALPVPPFTWEHAARATVEAHMDLLNSARPIRLFGDQRPRVAYVTLLPPVESGIARYSCHLLAELAHVAQVRCFSDQDLLEAVVPPNVAISPLSDLPMMQAVGEFDYVVVALGNNVLHRSALDMVARLGGFVHLHDVRLVNCYAHEAWPDVVERQYPQRFSHAELSVMEASWSDEVRSKSVFLLADLAASATGVFVHSNHAASLVELDVGTIAVDIGPLATAHREQLATGGVDPNLVVSLGIVSSAKQSAKIISAAGVLDKRGSELRFVLVGFGGHEFTELPRNVHLTGLVSDEEYAEYLGKAAIAVQLRDFSNGESSAAVSDCLGVGTPVVVTDLGSAAELSDEMVAKVPRDITAHELADVIENLVADAERRESMAAAALRYAHQHSFESAAKRLLAALEATRGSVPRRHGLPA